MSTVTAFLIVLILVLYLFVLNWFRPLFGFFTFMTCRILFDKFSMYGPGIRGVNASSLFGIFIIAYSLYIIPLKHNARFFPPVLRMYFVFLIATLPSAMASSNLMDFTIQWTKLLTMACLYLIPYNLIQNEDDARSAIRLFALSSVPVMLFGFWQLVTNTGFKAPVGLGRTLFKIDSTLLHPNAYSFYLGLIFFALYAIHQKNIWSFITTGYMMLANLSSIILTYSRSVWFTLLGSVLFLMAANKRLNLKLVGVLLLIGILFAPLISLRMEDLFVQSRHHSSSLDFRIEMTRQLLGAFTENPTIGYGLGSSLEVAERYSDYLTFPHNDYVRVLIESGLSGFTGFIIFIGASLLFIVRHRRHLNDNAYVRTASAATIFFAVIIVGTNQLGNVTTAGMWFMLMGILHKASLLSLANEEK